MRLVFSLLNANDTRPNPSRDNSKYLEIELAAVGFGILLLLCCCYLIHRCTRRAVVETPESFISHELTRSSRGLPPSQPEQKLDEDENKEDATALQIDDPLGHAVAIEQLTTYLEHISRIDSRGRRRLPDKSLSASSSDSDSPPPPQAGTQPLSSESCSSEGLNKLIRSQPLPQPFFVYRTLDVTGDSATSEDKTDALPELPVVSRMSGSRRNSGLFITIDSSPRGRGAVITSNESQSATPPPKKTPSR